MKREELELLAERLVTELKCPEKHDKLLNALCKWDEEEKLKKACKQKAGIEAARENGVVIGRPKIKDPDNFEKICKRFFNHEVSAIVAAEACGMGVSTFYRRIRKIKEERHKGSEA